jgi:hypothetical protein
MTVTGSKMRRLYFAFGAAVMFVSLGYVGFSIWSQRAVLEAFSPDSADLLLLLLGTTIYASTGFLLAEAWRYLLVWSGEKNVRPQEALRIYARTQIARYVAGNIAQLASRQMLGRLSGWTHFGLGVSGLFELFSQISVGAIITLLAVAATGLQTGREMGEAAFVLLGVIAAALFILPRVARLITARYGAEFGTRLAKCRLVRLWPAMLMHLGFFISGGVVLDLVVYVVMPGAPLLLDLPAMIGLFAAAWLCGCITPGAPAGIGVREAVLTYGLASMMQSGDALLVAGLLRLITLGGDLLFFAWAGRLGALRASGAGKAAPVRRSPIRRSTDPSSSSPPRTGRGPCRSTGD